MSNNTNRRLVKEYNIIKTLIDKEIFTAPLKDNLLLWQAVLLGPDDTIWEGGCFKLSLEFPKDYPTNPPTVKFITKMFHPNSKILLYTTKYFLLFLIKFILMEKFV
jgi:ubiquitin-conjugating enzyme E2 A